MQIMLVRGMVRSVASIVTTAVLAILLLAGMTGCSAADKSAADIPLRAPTDEGEAGRLLEETQGEMEAAVGLESEVVPAPVEDGGTADVEQEQQEEVAAEGNPSPSEPRVDLVFFQTFNACGCLGEIGDVIKTALYQDLPEEMEDKSVRFYSLYSDDPANQTYVRMYGSQPFDFFIVTYEGGRAAATPVREIWILMDDYDALGAYVVQRVEQSLGRR